MAKSKDKTEVEHFRGVNRSLKAEIRHLKRELGRKNKQIKVYDQFVGDPDPEPEALAFVDKTLCPKCRGSLDVVDLVIKNLYVCNTGGCNFRKTVKKSGDKKV